MRGKHFTDTDVNDPEKYPDVVPFNLEDNEKTTWNMIVYNALSKAVPGLPAIPQPNAKAEFKYGLKDELHDVGFWNLLESRMSSEAWQFVSFSAFALSLFRNWNAYDSVKDYLRLGASFESGFLSINDGFEALARRLESKFVAKKGRTILECHVDGIRRTALDSEPLFELTATGQDGETRGVRARSVVLALPKRALEMLGDDSVMYESPKFAGDLNAVSATPAYRAYMSYDKAWWASDVPLPDCSIQGGYAMSDLPIRVCYYMGSEPGGRALLNTSLSDEHMALFWQGYSQRSPYGTAPAIYEVQDKSIPVKLRPPKRLIYEMRRQLKAMHNLQDDPKPVDAIFFNWADDPFGGGWHSWKPYEISRQTIPRMRQPVPNTNVFICGEAYSDLQGWVEGALNCAEKVLIDHYGISRFSGLANNYDLGP
jgi:monoamine oxidase